MSKTKKIISLVLAALLIMAMATVAVSAMSADEIHVVAGEAGLCGSGWDPADTNNQMTYNAEKDIYEKVFTGIAAGTYAFKVTTNYGWDNGDFNLEGDAMYGGPNASVTVDADGSTVIVGFNGMHATVEVVAGTDTPVDPTTAPADDATTAPADDVTDAPVVGDTITFYFTNNQGWAAVNAHTWDSNGALDAGWPGAAMTFVETNDFGQDVYSITVPASATGVVFNAGEGQAQTTDVAPENGKGYYCVEQDAEGKWTTESYDYIVVDPTTAPADDVTTAPADDVTTAPADDATTAPADDVTTAPVEDTTAATTPDAPVTGNGVKVEGVAVGDEIVYTYTLTTPAAIENVQATTYFDATKLELVEGKAKEMFPVLRDITSVVYNTDLAGQVKFNATEGVEEGFDFTEGGVLVTLKFKVLDASVSEINTVLEEMVKFGEKVDFATNGEIVAEGVEFEQTITGGSGPVVTTTESTPVTTPTTAPTTGAPAEGNGVTVGGVEYGVTEGDIITYTYVLTTPAPIENVQATTYYDAAKLELIEGKAKEMFPVLRDITSVVYNTDIAGQVKFNATEGVEEGFDFTQGGVLVTLQFKVLDTTPSEIYTVIEEMVKFGEKVDFATGGEIVADGVTGAESLTGNTTPTTSAPTTAEPTTAEPTTAEPTTAEPTTAEPTTAEPTTAEPTTAEPTTVEPTEGKTDAPAPGTDATSNTEAGTTAPNADAPATGAAAYIYVVVAVLAMAACAVVVLRKRANG